MPRGETDAHRTLKRLALDWAHAQGFTCCAPEVRIPKSSYRADVAAYRPTASPSSRQEPALGVTAVFECKQSRADLLQDSAQLAPALARLAQLQERRAVLERLLRVHLPSLISGDSLFQEYDTLNRDAVAHRGYQGTLREIAAVQTRIFGRNKFERLIRYRAANLCYLVITGGILEPHELPLHWGLLVRDHDFRLRLVRRPTWQEVPAATRLLLLERIARSSARRANRACQLTFTDLLLRIQATSTESQPVHHEAPQPFGG